MGTPLPHFRLPNVVEEHQHPAQVTGYHGKRLADSWGNRKTDSAVGKLVPKPFKIVRSKLSFLIGGGDHPGETCINLLVGILESVSSQLAILRSPTVFREANGTLHGWEGSWPGDGSCPGTVTHVYHYAQSIAYLFPGLERAMREFDFSKRMDPETGGLRNRVWPTQVGEAGVSADGHFGTILRLCREWQANGDTEWLGKLWPNVKKAIAYPWISWDKDRDGRLDSKIGWGSTLDQALYGDETYGNSMYMASMLAGEKMERSVGDIYPRERMRSAISAVFKYNFVPDCRKLLNTGYTLAVNDDAGLVICSWPKGGRPAQGLSYADTIEVGYEDQVAANLVYHGYMLEGIAVMKAIRDRYDGRKRDPYCQLECGGYYARSLANYSLILALAGYRYSAVEGCLEMAPKVNPDDFRCFFGTASGWGEVTQQRKGATQFNSVTLRHGTLKLRSFACELSSAANSSRQGPDTEAGANAKAFITCGGQAVSGHLTMKDGKALVMLEKEIVIGSGNKLEIKLSGLAGTAKNEMLSDPCNESISERAP